MSETEHIKGRLTPVENPEGLTGVQLIEKILKDKNIRIESYHNDSIDCFRDELRYQYFYHKNSDKIFTMTKEEIDPYDDIIRATANPDNTIDFECRYYNGGTCLDECVDEALTKLLKA